MERKQASCYWITGLSGSGKTTLSTFLADHVRSSGRAVVQLDGDELRGVLATDAYTREERIAIGMRYSRLCKLIASQGIDVVIGVIGLFEEIHRWNRENIPGYIEVFIDTPMDELQRRDLKGIYARAQSGNISNVAGVDLEVDYPADPHIHLRWEEGKEVHIMTAELVEKIASC